jgi:hypothetical protein
MRALLLLALLAAIAGCTTLNAPPGFLPPSAEDAASAVRGGWATASLHGGTTVQGELLAVGPDSLYLLPLGGSATVVPRTALTSLRVEVHEGGGVVAGTWAGVGLLSTFSHGVFLLLTAPLWAITLAATAPGASRLGIRSYPRQPWEELAPHARFPQGLPPGYARPGARP